MNGERPPVARTPAQIVANVEGQVARHRLITILQSDLCRLLIAMRDGDPDVLRLADAVQSSTRD